MTTTTKRCASIGLPSMVALSVPAIMHMTYKGTQKWASDSHTTQLYAQSR